MKPHPEETLKSQVPKMISEEVRNPNTELPHHLIETLSLPPNSPTRDGATVESRALKSTLNQVKSSRNATLDHSEPILSVATGCLGCIRVSNGCHRKFRGHNFDSCVTNFDKISVFSLRSRYGKFRGFHRHFGIRTAVSNLQNMQHEPHTRTHDSARRAARSAAGLWGAGAEDGETV